MTKSIIVDSPRFEAPKPAVLHLPTLFRDVNRGKIKIPAFQRDFVWTEVQVLELLESVYKGFPIGSLLFWQVSEQKLMVDRSDHFPFPKVEENYPLNYVLDGLQRLAALYGAMFWPDRSKPGMFNVVFDLESDLFRHFDADEVTPFQLPLSCLFAPQELLKAQAALSKKTNADKLIEKSVALQSIYQQYMVPTITISERSIDDVVKIFERINSTGTRLGQVDFMRALTWSEQFDLNKEAERLVALFEERGFLIPTETVVKVLAVLMGHMPTSTSMLRLREASPGALSTGIENEVTAIEKTLQFLIQRSNILSYDYIPYEGQFIVLTKFFHEVQNPTEHQLSKLEDWFWTVSLNEELRGKPDHYVARILAKLEKLIRGDLEALQLRLTVTADTWMERRLIVGKALSAAMASLCARNKARSLISGDVILPEEYMVSFDAQNYLGLLSLKTLRDALKKELPSNKLIANTVVTTATDRKVMKNQSLQSIFRDLHDRDKENARLILDSQFISEAAEKALLNDDYIGFLRERADAIMSYVNTAWKST